MCNPSAAAAAAASSPGYTDGEDQTSDFMADTSTSFHLEEDPVVIHKLLRCVNRLILRLANKRAQTRQAVGFLHLAFGAKVEFFCSLLS